MNMKLGIGLYRHMLTPEYFQFARQCGCTHLIVHLATYYDKQVVTATDENSNSRCRHRKGSHLGAGQSVGTQKAGCRIWS